MMRLYFIIAFLFLTSALFAQNAGDVIINEIYAAPSTSAGVPDAEYIELYNTTNTQIDLSNWTITDNNGPEPFPGGAQINPQSYLIVTDDGDSASFTNQGFTPVVGLTSFPSLNNGGDELALKDDQGTLIDSVAYSNSQVTSGVSLELIDPNTPCSGSSVWALSTDTAGGTPSHPNSVEDQQSPTLTTVAPTAEDTLVISFDEALAKDSATAASNFSISPSGPQVDTAFANGNTVTLVLSPPLDSSTFYTLYVNDMLQDCFGNSVTDTMPFQMPGAVSKGQLIINEVYAAPASSSYIPNAEYIELFNTTGSTINLSNWTIADESGYTTFASGAQINPQSYLIVTDNGDSSSFANKGYMPVKGLSSFPALNNGGDELILKDSKSNRIDSMNYSGSQVFSGVSLELIDPNTPCSGPSIWAPSKDTAGGTPGLPNTVEDQQSPSLTSVVPAAEDTLLVQFDELLAEDSAAAATNFQISPSGPQVNEVFTSDSTVTLVLNPALDSATLYTLYVNGQLQDCFGNNASDSAIFQLPGAGAPGDLVINEFSAVPPNNQFPDSIPQEEYVEVKNTANRVMLLEDWHLVGDSETARLPQVTLAPDSMLIMTATGDTSLFTSYGQVIGLSGMPALNNDGEHLAILNDQKEWIYSVTYKGSDLEDGKSLELVNPYSSCSIVSANWRVSQDPTGGTPGRANSVLGLFSDTTGPRITGLDVNSATSITLTFNEPLDSLRGANIANYSIDNGLGTPSNASPLPPDYTSVKITLPQAMDSSTIYTITTNGLADCFGNRETDSIRFALPVTAQRNSVIINEIMPDEDPAVALPEYEYVELYNRSDHAVELNGWELADRTSSGDLENRLLLPDKYVILCDDGKVDSFRAAGYRNVIGVSSLPSLNETNDDLTLTNANGKLINALFYSDDWYQSDEKADGGWSLERIDPDVPCNNAGNWKESEADDGGTPGLKNSVLGQFDDDTPPELLRAIVHDSTHVELLFSESLDSTTAFTESSYNIDNNIGQPDSADPIGPQYRSVDLFLNQPLDRGTVYTVTVDNITDCAGNTIQMNNTARFGIPEPIDSFDIAINEVLFNPERGSDGVDYVELYNRSGQILDLSELMIGEAAPVIPDQIEEQAPISERGYLFMPGTYLALSEDQELVKKQKDSKNPDNFIDISAMPNYPNDEGVVILAKDSSTFIDHLAYKDDWHFELLDDEDGVSLERINYEEPTQNEDNWHSAASTVGYGTPAYQNSQFGLSENLADKVTVSPEVFSPDGDGHKDFLTISYQFQKGGYSANITIFDAKGREIKRLARNELLGYEGRFRWDGVTGNGQKARIGYYVIYFEVFDENGDAQRFKKTAVLGGKID